MKPVGIEDLQAQNVSIPKLSSDSTIVDLVGNKQIISILDENIPAQHRTAYLKLKYGDKVYKTELNKLLECIRTILKEHNYDIEE